MTKGALSIAIKGALQAHLLGISLVPFRMQAPTN